MKKILHILSQRPEKTGSGIFLQNIFKEAAKKDYKQAAVAGVPKNLERVDLGVIDKEDFYPVKFETERIPFAVVGMSNVMPYKSERYMDLTDEMLKKWKLGFKEQITKAIEEFKPDLILSHHLWILTSFLQEFITDIPIKAICHGTGLRQLKQTERFADYVTAGCRKADTIFALHDQQKEKISQLYEIDPEKIIVIGSGYDSDIFYTPNNNYIDDLIRIVYAGKLSYSKGIKSLIRAYNKLNFARDKLELVLVGNGSGKEVEEIKRMAQNSRFKVSLTGAVPQAKVGDIFRQADIFCLPSFYEGLPLVLIEALASGLRVVTTNLQGVKEWIGNKINNSGAIEYVKLPSLKEPGVPIEDDLVEFEMRLQKALEKQINNLEADDYLENQDLIKAIKRMSWTGVLERMEEHF
ncbi:glycosyltransferase family 4 protein [Sporohalobacter salinus]|uniref:glycosyltransferase family 4 protein n=1 Tax=Sporohalobacter salinus TaxID=1494606 RepID=UPI0019613CA2|nr:glycosyltransferase family 4 protein [Sporohalobacter salinus]MBM7625035.1 glycosyltransferase involved in cell wall biosynthesis [Sporohalobacter salinus]